jgi:hypothetical protein
MRGSAEFAARCRFDEQHQRNHAEANDAEDPEDVEEDEHVGLTLQFPVKHGAGLRCRGSGGSTLGAELGGEALKRLNVARAVAQVTNQARAK